MKQWGNATTKKNKSEADLQMIQLGLVYRDF